MLQLLTLLGGLLPADAQASSSTDGVYHPHDWCQSASTAETVVCVDMTNPKAIHTYRPDRRQLQDDRHLLARASRASRRAARVTDRTSDAGKQAHRHADRVVARAHRRVVAAGQAPPDSGAAGLSGEWRALHEELAAQHRQALERTSVWTYRKYWWDDPLRVIVLARSTDIAVRVDGNGSLIESSAIENANQPHAQKPSDLTVAAFQAWPGEPSTLSLQVVVKESPKTEGKDEKDTKDSEAASTYRMDIPVGVPVWPVPTHPGLSDGYRRVFPTIGVSRTDDDALWDWVTLAPQASLHTADDQVLASARLVTVDAVAQVSVIGMVDLSHVEDAQPTLLAYTPNNAASLFREVATGSGLDVRLPLVAYDWGERYYGAGVRRRSGLDVGVRLGLDPSWESTPVPFEDLFLEASWEHTNRGGEAALFLSGRLGALWASDDTFQQALYNAEHGTRRLALYGTATLGLSAASGTRIGLTFYGAPAVTSQTASVALPAALEVGYGK